MKGARRLFSDFPFAPGEEIFAEDPYPGEKEYAWLYANYLLRSEELDLTEAQMIKALLSAWASPQGKKVCEWGAGSALPTRELARLGARALALDAQGAMLAKDEIIKAGGSWREQEAQAFIQKELPGSWDAFCAKQSIAYFFRSMDWAQASLVLSSKGLLVFNAFDASKVDQEASRVFNAPEGDEIWEAHRIQDGRVLHWQKRGGKLRRTSFAALTEEEIRSGLSPFFHEERLEKKGQSALWVWSKKG